MAKPFDWKLSLALDRAIVQKERAKTSHTRHLRRGRSGDWKSEYREVDNET